MAKKDEVAPAAPAAKPATAGESRPCKNLDEARQAIDELGYPVMVDGVVHEKKVAALAAVDAALAGVSGGKCTVARPQFA